MVVTSCLGWRFDAFTASSMDKCVGIPFILCYHPYQGFIEGVVQSLMDAVKASQSCGLSISRIGCWVFWRIFESLAVICPSSSSLPCRIHSWASVWVVG